MNDEVIFDNRGNILTQKEEDIARKDFDDWKEKDPKNNKLEFKNYLKKIWFNNEIRFLPQQNNDQITTFIENSIIKSEDNEFIEDLFGRKSGYKTNKKKTIKWFLQKNRKKGTKKIVE